MARIREGNGQLDVFTGSAESGLIDEVVGGGLTGHNCDILILLRPLDS